MVFRFGIFPEDVILGRSEPTRGAVWVGRNEDTLSCLTKPTSCIHDSSNLRSWDIHKTLGVSGTIGGALKPCCYAGDGGGAELQLRL